MGEKPLFSIIKFGNSRGVQMGKEKEVQFCCINIITVIPVDEDSVH